MDQFFARRPATNQARWGSKATECLFRPDGSGVEEVPVPQVCVCVCVCVRARAHAHLRDVMCVCTGSRGVTLGVQHYRLCLT